MRQTRSNRTTNRVGIVPLLILFVLHPDTLIFRVAAWDPKFRGKRVDNINYYNAFELLGQGWCTNSDLNLERRKKTVASESECASLCIQEERCSGFGHQRLLYSDCEIYGPKLDDSVLLPVPPWTYYIDPASRPEIPNGQFNTECYRKTFNADGTNVKHCEIAAPDDSKYYYARPCQEGFSIAEGGSCTLTCNTQAGYVPFPAPPLKATCINGQLLSPSMQAAGCVTAAQQVNLQLLASTSDISWPAKRLSASLTSWWFSGVNLDILYSPERTQAQRYFQVLTADFETWPICNGYEHYPGMRGNGGLVLPMDIDLVTEMRHSLQYALQLPNQTYGLQISSCEYNRTRAMLYLPSPFGSAAEEQKFLRDLNNRTMHALVDVNIALRHNLRFNRMPNLLEYNETHGFVFLNKLWSTRQCNEEFTYDNYVGCAYTTTTGLRCQTWEEIIPHLHPFSTLTADATTPLLDDRGFNEENPYVQQELINRQNAIDASTTKAPETFGVTTRSPNAPSDFGVTNYNPDVFYPGGLLVDLPLDQNYCRNPDGRNQGQADKGGSNSIWCFTVDPLLRFDYCSPMVVNPVPEVCRTLVRGDQLAPQQSMINLDGNPILRNATTVRPFLVPHESISDDSLKCQDVHPDFDGDLFMTCNPEDLTITFDISNCNDTKFFRNDDMLVDRYKEILVVDASSYQDCRKAAIDHGLSYFRERPEGFEYQSFTTVPVAPGSVETELRQVTSMNCLLYQKSQGFRLKDKTDQGDVVAVYELRGVPYEWATSDPQFRVTGKADAGEEGGTSSFMLGGGAFLGVLIAYQIYSSCRSGELQALLFGGDARDGEGKSSGISAFQPVFKHAKLIPFNPDIMLAKRKAGSTEERAAEQGGLSKEEAVRKFIKDREVLEANIEYAEFERKEAIRLKREAELEKTKEIFAAKLLILKNFFFDGNKWRGYDPQPLVREEDGGEVDEDRGKIEKKKKKAGRLLTKKDSKLDRRRLLTRRSSSAMLAEQEIGLEPHPNQVLSVRKAGILMSNLLKRSDGRISGMRADDEDGSKTEGDRRHLHYALSQRGKKVLKDVKKAVTAHEIERGFGWVNKMERTLSVPDDMSKQRNMLTPFVTKYYVRKALDEEDRIMERQPHRIIRAYRKRHQVTQKVRSHLYKKRSFFHAMGWDPLRDEAGTLHLKPLVETKSAKSKKEKLKNKGVIATEVELDAQYTMEMEAVIAQKALAPHLKDKSSKLAMKLMQAEQERARLAAEAASAEKANAAPPLTDVSAELPPLDEETLGTAELVKEYNVAEAAEKEGSHAEVDSNPTVNLDGGKEVIEIDVDRPAAGPPGVGSSGTTGSSNQQQPSQQQLARNNQNRVSPLTASVPVGGVRATATPGKNSAAPKITIISATGKKPFSRERIAHYVQREKRLRRKAHSVSGGGRMETNAIIGPRGVYPWQKNSEGNVRRFKDRMKFLFKHEYEEKIEKKRYENQLKRKKKMSAEDKRIAEAFGDKTANILNEFIPKNPKVHSPLLLHPLINASRTQPIRFQERHKAIWIRGLDFQVAKDYNSIVHYCDLAKVEDTPVQESIAWKISRLVPRKERLKQKQLLKEKRKRGQGTSLGGTNSSSSSSSDDQGSIFYTREDKEAKYKYPPTHVSSLENTNSLFSSTMYRNFEIDIDWNDPIAVARYKLWTPEDPKEDDTNIVLCKDYRLPPISHHSYHHYGHVCSEARLKGLLNHIDTDPAPVVTDVVTSTVVSVLRNKPFLLTGDLSAQVVDEAGGASVAQKRYAWDEHKQRLFVEKVKLGGAQKWVAHVVHAQRSFLEKHWALQTNHLSPRGEGARSIFGNGLATDAAVEEEKSLGHSGVSTSATRLQERQLREDTKQLCRVSTRLERLVSAQLQMEKMERALRSEEVIPEISATEAEEGVVSGPVEAAVPAVDSSATGTTIEQVHQEQSSTTSTSVQNVGLSIQINHASNFLKPMTPDMDLHPFVRVTILKKLKEEEPEELHVKFAEKTAESFKSADKHAAAVGKQRRSRSKESLKSFGRTDVEMFESFQTNVIPSVKNLLAYSSRSQSSVARSNTTTNSFRPSAANARMVDRANDLIKWEQELLFPKPAEKEELEEILFQVFDDYYRDEKTNEPLLLGEARMSVQELDQLISTSNVSASSSVLGLGSSTSKNLTLTNPEEAKQPPYALESKLGFGLEQFSKTNATLNEKRMKRALNITVTPRKLLNLSIETVSLNANSDLMQKSYEEELPGCFVQMEILQQESATRTRTSSQDLARVIVGEPVEETNQTIRFDWNGSLLYKEGNSVEDDAALTNTASDRFGMITGTSSTTKRSTTTRVAFYVKKEEERKQSTILGEAVIDLDSALQTNGIDEPIELKLQGLNQDLASPEDEVLADDGAEMKANAASPGFVGSLIVRLNGGSGGAQVPSGPAAVVAKDQPIDHQNATMNPSTELSVVSSSTRPEHQIPEIKIIPPLAALKWVATTELPKKARLGSSILGLAKAAAKKGGVDRLGKLAGKQRAACEFILQKPDGFQRGRNPDVRFERFPGRSDSAPARYYPQSKAFSDVGFFDFLGEKLRRVSVRKKEEHRIALEKQHAERMRRKQKLEAEKVYEAQQHLGFDDTAATAAFGGLPERLLPTNTFSEDFFPELTGFRVTVKSGQDLNEESWPLMGKHRIDDPVVKIYVGSGNFQVGHAAWSISANVGQKKQVSSTTGEATLPSFKRQGKVDPDTLLFTSDQFTRNPSAANEILFDPNVTSFSTLLQDSQKYFRFQVFDRDWSNSELIGEAILHRGFFHAGFDGNLKLWKKFPPDPKKADPSARILADCGSLNISIVPIGKLQLFVERADEIYEPDFAALDKCNPWIKINVGSSFSTRSQSVKNTRYPLWEYQCAVPWDPRFYEQLAVAKTQGSTNSNTNSNLSPEQAEEEKKIIPVVHFEIYDKEEKEPTAQDQMNQRAGVEQVPLVSGSELRKFQVESGTVSQPLQLQRRDGANAGTLFLEILDVEQPVVGKKSEKLNSEKRYQQLIWVFGKDCAKKEKIRRDKEAASMAKLRQLSKERTQSKDSSVHLQPGQDAPPENSELIVATYLRNQNATLLNLDSTTLAIAKQLAAEEVQLPPFFQPTLFASRRIIVGQQLPPVLLPSQVRRNWWQQNQSAALALLPRLAREMFQSAALAAARNKTSSARATSATTSIVAAGSTSSGHNSGLLDSETMKANFAATWLPGIPRMTPEDAAIICGVPFLHLTNIAVPPALEKVAEADLDEFFNVGGEQVRISLPLSKKNALKLPKDGVAEQSAWHKILPSVYEAPETKRKPIPIDLLLTIEVKRAQNIYPENFIGTADPFVRVLFRDQVFETKIVTNNRQDPIWDQKFETKVPASDEMLQNLLRFEIYDADAVFQTKKERLTKALIGKTKMKLEYFAKRHYDGGLSLKTSSRMVEKKKVFEEESLHAPTLFVRLQLEPFDREEAIKAAALGGLFLGQSLGNQLGRGSLMAARRNRKKQLAEQQARERTRSELSSNASPDTKTDRESSKATSRSSSVSSLPNRAGKKKTSKSGLEQNPDAIAEEGDATNAPEKKLKKAKSIAELALASHKKKLRDAEVEKGNLNKIKSKKLLEPNLFKSPRNRRKHQEAVRKHKQERRKLMKRTDEGDASSASEAGDSKEKTEDKKNGSELDSDEDQIPSDIFPERPAVAPLRPKIFVSGVRYSDTLHHPAIVDCYADVFKEAFAGTKHLNEQEAKEKLRKRKLVTLKKTGNTELNSILNVDFQTRKHRYKKHGREKTLFDADFIRTQQGFFDVDKGEFSSDRRRDPSDFDNSFEQSFYSNLYSTFSQEDHHDEFRSRFHHSDPEVSFTDRSPSPDGDRSSMDEGKFFAGVSQVDREFQSAAGGGGGRGPAQENNFMRSDSNSPNTTMRSDRFLGGTGRNFYTGRVEIDLGETDDEVNEYEQYYWERRGKAILTQHAEQKRVRTRGGEPKEYFTLNQAGVRLDLSPVRRNFTEHIQMRNHERELREQARLKNSGNKTNLVNPAWGGILPLSDGRGRRDLVHVDPTGIGSIANTTLSSSKSDKTASRSVDGRAKPEIELYPAIPKRGSLREMAPNFANEPNYLQSGRRSPLRIARSMDQPSSGYSSAKEIPTSPSVERERRRRLLGAKKRTEERDYSPNLQLRMAAGNKDTRRDAFRIQIHPDDDVVEQADGYHPFWRSMFSLKTSSGSKNRPGFWTKQPNFDPVKAKGPPTMTDFRTRDIVQDMAEAEADDQYDF
ncbi:unnamed protein product [Amoebophrya sp. A120]|nr:unnamed protein product [Amoebophrya sp. A120]|eukprot:GSA120T00021309001.1